ncbi:type I-E CRISPR-associated protein Cse1/CasA [Acidithiobacillus caldus]|jgi:CRISPR system Cascade subunit CasA|uniref:Type I-E CRISPR-associated protein Cse1/CasA n=1 Tax=Acidithiobacillus caldus TaxID=33059 RepID=A0A1E7YMJ5_9PROT|nr:type I-E CRISPR-associated protein Cse1/CasA [Acidithiobacillus caldus]MBU2789393.1 type I-E CRISPR-associated protein Cse1/CasA [Acidithiobacillus caldus]MBU2820319.1 type I-E CRISPR-associated protein Cse1/CasA [Acidithiobacillus caldus]OFC35077.1 type I-E CRISPR-associated protein Cse1/CasA [Acidithiobacillus caldus]OFC36299.1 type I-E CRISPR-associated protein Cse1/CasA [Acidithiobacillus caldus]OFC40585.1 type I-E CRISPR-associated protein Cse1/CasA [Acidithiobacillus caldus]
MNLITDQWIPVRHTDGTSGRIRPAQLGAMDNPPVALDAPRADFNGALAQFLIGLLQTAFPPADGDEWLDRLEQPPSEQELGHAFSGYAHAFDLDGDGPRFMQDYEALEKTLTEQKLENAAKPIEWLLIDSPSENTLENNTDHFVKRGYAARLCPACAATALFTLQLNAPSGGVGHRTSLRGGGPLTTLVTLDPKGSDLPDTLWHNLWLNILPATARLTGNPGRDTPEDIFPWLAPTRTSNPEAGGQDTTPMDAHPHQMYWAMPRRIRLDFDELHAGSCDLCGAEGQVVRRYFTINYGINYTGAWRHPLSPYRERNEGEPLPLHPQPGGIGYRLWPGLVYSKTEGKQRIVPALVVEEFLREAVGMGQARIWAFGYDMDNMKPRCWYEATLPLYRVPDSILADFAQCIRQMIESADLVSGILKTCIKEAWFKRPGDARGNTGFLADGFWQHTETDFYAHLPRLIAAIPQDRDREVLADWYGALKRAAQTLFDEWTSSGDVAFSEPERIARAHDKLVKQLNGRKLKHLLSLPTTQENVA